MGFKMLAIAILEVRPFLYEVASLIARHTVLLKAAPRYQTVFLRVAQREQPLD